MSSMFSRSISTAGSTASGGDLSKDVQLTSPPDDSISDLSWSPATNHLAVASWDSQVRIYDVSQNPSGVGKAIINFDGPVFGCAWSKDGQKVAGSSADKTVRLLDLGANGASAQQVASHDGPIKSLRFFEIPTSHSPLIATGSWDKTVKYWDLRQPTAAATLPCQDRVYSLDVKGKLLVVATAERYINIVNLTEPTQFFKTERSPLLHQTRVISCFHDSSGYALGSIEGRCAIQYLEPKGASDHFAFRCHRNKINKDVVNCFSVNAISFHPTYGTFSTAGSDGTFHFWDKDARQKLKGFSSVGGTVSATAFNNDGSTFAYAISYDWSKGYAHNSPQHINKVMLHRTTNEECKPYQAVRRL